MTQIRLASLPLIALALACATAQPQPARPAEKPQPPALVDREIFFGDPEYSGAQLSPDGAWISFMKPLDGTRNLWVKRRGEPFEKARPITADTKRPIPAHFWSVDSKYVLFVQDHDGDENFNVFAVDPSAPNREGGKVPEARALTDLKGVRAQIMDVPRKRPGVLYVGLNDRDAAWHDLYEVEIATGKRTLLYKNEQRISGYDFDHQGKLRLLTRTTEAGDTEILRLAEGAAPAKIYGCGVLESCNVVAFHVDDKRAYLMTNAGTADLIRLEIIDVESGKSELVEQDPKGSVDLMGPIFSPATEQLVGTVYYDDRVRFQWSDAAYAQDLALVAQKYPGVDVTIASQTLDDKLWLLSLASDVEPGVTALFDRATKELSVIYRVRENLPREALSSKQAIRYPSSDGLVIPAYLTLPKGYEPKGLPLIVLPHGGPWGRDRWGYSGLVQFLANRGYAVLQPNFRASTGYGKKFLDAGNKEWGDKMQDDLTWGVRQLVGQGTADPKRVGIMGGSYGGYATLAGVTFTPDLYAAAVAIVAPSNLLTLLETIPPYWEAGRVVFYTRMGDPRTPEGKAQLVRQSPLTHAGKIKTPLVVVQGANDPRVKKAEADQIVVALRDRGYPVEYILAPDEGHGFQRPINNLATFAEAEKFFAARLGGRLQETMTPEVSKRLAEITVDPKTVSLAKRPQAPEAKATGPLTAGTWKYKITMEMGPNKMEMETTTEIKAEGAGFSVVDAVKTPQGTAYDRSLLDASLNARTRTVEQGPATFTITYAQNKASGVFKMGAQERPIAADLTGEIFADGAGGNQALGLLPLAEGYKASYRNFDWRKAQEKRITVEVAGAEEVTVPGGRFTAWKLVNSTDEGDETLVWIDQQSRAVVKVSAKGPSMGGATVAAELLSAEPAKAAAPAKPAKKPAKKK
jgi:dipeptidyl aminopeptidase/acylaminoacyl peptidase